MARKPAGEKVREYEELKKFFVHWLREVSPRSHLEANDPIHPLNVLARFEQQLTFSQVLAGLRQAVGDSLEEAEDWDSVRIRRADEQLRAAGAPTLSQLITSRSKKFRQILRRGRIRDDTEFYLVSAALADTGTERSGEEMEQLSAMLVAYEARA
jgi:hypothetical protein